MRHALQIQVKQGAAARQNAKAEMVVADNKKKQRRVLQERKENHEMEMAAHVQRHDGIVKERSAKGLAEVEKVKEAVASLHQAEADTIAQGARAQDDAMLAAAERRTAKLQEVQARGHAESEKVAAATAKLQEEAEARAAKLEADASAAAERRAARLGATAAKAAAESEKVERAQLWSVTPSRAAGGEGSGSALASPSTDLQKPRQRMRLQLDTDAPAPSAAAVAQTSGLLLQLMRGGAPNSEVLLASTVEEYLALGAKYGIALQGPTPVPPAQ